MKKFFAYLQYLLPKTFLSVLAGQIADSRWPWLKSLLIKRFINTYHIDLSIAVIEDANQYPTFNDFFTRRLKTELRPIDQQTNSIVSAVDGVIAQMGKVQAQQLLQAKNFHFDLKSLLAGDSVYARRFENGSYATLYLAPRHYHRVHMPISGKLVQTTFVPGHLFSVNTTTSEYIPNLYSRNERLICLFETEAGSMAVIFVGAMIVGSIQPSWMTAPIRSSTIKTQTHDRLMQKGDELGCFKLGSTVILLFENNQVDWIKALPAEVKMGQAIGFRHI